MKDCDDKFAKVRAIPDPRLKATLKDDGSMEWKYQDMNQVVARELCQRAALHLRLTDMYNRSDGIKTHPEAGLMAQVEYYPDLPEKSVCFAYHPKSGAFQASVSGMTIFQACILLESAALDIERNNQLVMISEPTNES